MGNENSYINSFNNAIKFSPDRHPYQHPGELGNLCFAHSWCREALGCWSWAFPAVLKSESLIYLFLKVMTAQRSLWVEVKRVCTCSHSCACMCTRVKRSDAVRCLPLALYALFSEAEFLLVANKPQGSSCLCFPSTRFKDVPTHLYFEEEAGGRD